MFYWEEARQTKIIRMTFFVIFGGNQFNFVSFFLQWRMITGKERYKVDRKILGEGYQHHTP